MPSHRSRRDFLKVSGTTVAVGLSGCTTQLTGPSPQERIQEFTATHDRFKDLRSTIKAGYRTVGTYIQDEEGTLGIPFVNFDIEVVEPKRPHAVLYDLTGDGKYTPLGLKWFVPADSRESPPTLFGKKFGGPYESDAPFIPRHYALHVWRFRENPNGLFARLNPAIEPAELVTRIRPVRERLRDFVIGDRSPKDAYRNTEKCIQTPDGGYGVPYVKNGEASGGGTDPMDPPILIFQLSTNWSYQLSGVEWYVPSSDATTPPSLFGQEFHPEMPGHSPQSGQPPHYGLHAWFFRANPRGMFAPFNPMVSC